MATFSDLPPELVDKIFSSLPAADVCRSRVSNETNQVFKDYFSGVHFLTQVPNDPRFDVPDDGVMSVLGQVTSYLKVYGIKSVLQCMRKVENRYYTIQGMEETYIRYVLEAVNHLFPRTPTGERITIGTAHDVYSIPASLEDAGHRRVSREAADGLKKLQEVLWGGVREPRGMWGVVPSRSFICLKDIAVMVDRRGEAYVTQAWNDAFDLELTYFNTDPILAMSRWTPANRCLFCNRWLNRPFDWFRRSGSGCRSRYARGIDRFSNTRPALVEVDI
eukprot:jgi/Mesvir1/8490/Mv12253-RA.1